MIAGAAYIRYSSNMQDDSFSLEAQLRQIKARAAQDGVEIVKVYADPAQSAYTKKHRPGVASMRTDAPQGIFNVVYVHKVDRLARRLEWAIDIVKELQHFNINLKAVEQNFDLATPEGKLMFHLLGSLGEFYSDNLSKETHKGKFERAMQGYHNGWVPWGYRSEKVDNHKLAIPDETLSPVVLHMFERYATGLYYDQEIADWLNSQGFVTQRSRPFTKDSIRDLLKNPFYIGLVGYKGVYAKTPGKTKELVQGLHQPLISRDLFDKCQKVRAQRHREVNTNQVTRRVYLLAGLITCSRCGRRLRAQSTKQNRYYRESARFTGTQCDHAGEGLRAEIAEEFIGQVMESLVLPEDWQTSLQEMLKTQKDGVDPQKEKTRIKGEMRRMREAFKHGLYDTDEHAFWREIESLQMELDSLEQLTPHEVRQAADTLVGLREAWQAANIEERRELCQIVLKEVTFDFDTHTFTSLRPKAEYDVLFQMVPSLSAAGNGEYRFQPCQ